MIGGFHSPMEKECLTLLLRGTQPVIVCPGRAIDDMRLPGSWKQPLAENRLLILSPFAKNVRRVTADTARARNRFVATLADQVLVAHAGAGSETERFVQDILTWGKPLWALASSENDHMIKIGVRALNRDGIADLIHPAEKNSGQGSRPGAQNAYPDVE